MLPQTIPFLYEIIKKKIGIEKGFFIYILNTSFAIFDHEDVIFDTTNFFNKNQISRKCKQ
jgi:hypothetical protein